jgi:DASH complex subunit DAM1
MDMQAPSDASFILAKRRAEQDSLAAAEALRNLTAQQTPSGAPPTEPDKTTATELDTEYDTTTTTTTTNTRKSLGGPKATVPISLGGLKKKAAKPKLSAKERKERGMAIESVVSSLPLEFRGNDPSLRKNMETVIEHLMDKEGSSGVKSEFFSYISFPPPFPLDFTSCSIMSFLPLVLDHVSLNSRTWH